jgi:hypothetical protein
MIPVYIPTPEQVRHNKRRVNRIGIVLLTILVLFMWYLWGDTPEGDVFFGLWAIAFATVLLIARRRRRNATARARRNATRMPLAGTHTVHWFSWR